MKVGIIGCGASGMMAALSAANEGHTVTIFEHGTKPGKKILATGNGKCNYTNANVSENNYNSESHELFINIYSKFDNQDTIDYFESIGIMPYVKNGYYYPRSEQASSVVTCLTNALLRNNVKVIYECNINKISKEKKNTRKVLLDSSCAANSEEYEVFKIKTNTGEYNVDKLIIAAGSNISEKTGSDGSGFELASSLGHTVKEPVPALCGLKCSGMDFKKVSGVRCQAKVSLYIDDKYIKEDLGELQLTDYGISGIPVFQISALALRGVLERKDVNVKIDFMPEILREDEVKSILKNRKETLNSTSIENFFDGLFNYKIGKLILDNSINNKILTCNDITDSTINKMISVIKDYNVKVIGHRGFENAQVCSGGIPCSEIKDTLESKKCSGLYFAGEIIDVNGDCGGYNLQWAWSSGYVAGKLK